MKRSTLDGIVSVGLLALAAVALVFGLVMQNQANFAEDYVRDQLTAQQIFFTPADALDEVESEVDCLVEYGGKQLTTGEQAECYANEYIGYHVNRATGGLSYAELGGPQRELRAQIAEAEANNAPNLEELQGELAKVDGQRETAFKGETLRGLLLTTYGFSILGERAALAATLAFVAAALMFLASVAGFVHYGAARKRSE